MNAARAVLVLVLTLIAAVTAGCERTTPQPPPPGPVPPTTTEPPRGDRAPSDPAPQQPPEPEIDKPTPSEPSPPSSPPSSAPSTPAPPAEPAPAEPPPSEPREQPEPPDAPDPAEAARERAFEIAARRQRELEEQLRENEERRRAAEEAANRPHPGQLLGLRVETVRRQSRVLPVVVIVPDAASYVAAVSGWHMDDRSPPVRYPVLIDDGSWQASENITRFCRGFSPERVVRWRSDAPWPRAAADQRAAIEGAVAAAWGAPSYETIADRWRQIDLSPPGVVLANEADPAWTAALALAAFRGQPIGWIDVVPGKNPSAGMSLAEAGALEDAARRVAGRLGYSFDGIGDGVDAVAICLNCGTKIKLPESDNREALALTDAIGRTDLSGARWAWAGQIFGDSADAAYRAMSALFTQPDRAWLFDGYPNEGGWSAFDMTPAAGALRPAIARVELDDNGSQGVSDFRRRASGRLDGPREDGSLRSGLETGLVMVNTKGMESWFDLSPGRAQAADAPIFNRPALVHFVHSWSAARLGARTSIAGRFLEHGAYAYVGSVNEPTLGGFVDSPSLARKLAGSMPLAAAARRDTAPVWKITVIGDPLTTIGPAAPRIALEDSAAIAAAAPALAGAEDAHDLIRAAATKRDYTQLFWLLAWTGDDARVVSLARALMRDDPASFTKEAAEAAIGPAFRRTATDLLSRASDAIGDGPARDALSDMVWHAISPTIGAAGAEEARLLASAVRQDNLVRDAEEAAAALARAVGPDAAKSLLLEAKLRAGNVNTKRHFDQLIARY